MVIRTGIMRDMGHSFSFYTNVFVCKEGFGNGTSVLSTYDETNIQTHSESLTDKILDKILNK